MSCFQAPVSTTVPSAAFPVPVWAGGANLKSNRSCFQAPVLRTTSVVGPNRAHGKAVDLETQPRRSAEYTPDIWGDRFLGPSPNALANESETILEHEKLKQQVKKLIIASAEDPGRNLDLVDSVQRLGLSYHFGEQIEEFLQKLLANLDGFVKDNAGNLHQISLCFRLLRQQGYKVSCDMFRSFKEDEDNFKESLKEDNEGLLSLYEATHLRVHGEDILEQALTSIITQLKSFAINNSSSPLSAQINHTLKHPIRKNFSRLDTRFYISTYQEKLSHNQMLLKFGKLDFNILQKQHQEELNQITRWWKELEVERNFPFARDRIVECFFFITGIYFEPQYALGRKITTKALAMLAILDDIYDVYGTPEELDLLTEAMERWDPDFATQLPEYIKNFYLALLDLYKEIEDDMGGQGNGNEYRAKYSREHEAKWYHQNFTPSVEEYMQVALVSVATSFLVPTLFIGMGEIATRDVFEWVGSYPKIIAAASIIPRLHDDIVGHEFEQKRGHPASIIECYMKEYGVTRQEVVDELNKQITRAWKDINEEWLLPTTIPPRHFHG
uniref:(+)-delta-cadinene synthase n=1 Tax=Aquilaria sinensis TaxID=210372 RepID=A0A8E8AT19_9ROSI|nr:terpene synthase 6 [Aquilaria sinensis]